jgi:hypothetical protein
MKAWIGKAIIAVGVIHNIFGFVVFRKTLMSLFQEGLFNTVNGQVEREFVFWFLALGLLAILLGLLVDWCEKNGLSLPSYFSWAFLFTIALFVFIMPISGVWLLFIPAVGMVLRMRRKETVKE